MEHAWPYLIVGLCVTSWVLIETWLEHRKMDEFCPNRDDFALQGVANSVLFGVFWPTALILFVLGKLLRK